MFVFLRGRGKGSRDKLGGTGEGLTRYMCAFTAGRGATRLKKRFNRVDGPALGYARKPPTAFFFLFFLLGEGGGAGKGFTRYEGSILRGRGRSHDKTLLRDYAKQQTKRDKIKL